MSQNATKHSANQPTDKPTNRRIKTPILLQMHASECGAACLGMILAYFGRWVPLTELREKCEVSRDGSSAGSLARAARHYGLDCKGMSLPPKLLSRVELPLIIFWQFSHFVVLEGITETHYYLNDPATGRRTVTREEFEKSYSQIALTLKPGEEFETGGEWPSLTHQLRTLMSGTWQVLTGVVACGLMLTLLLLVFPYTLGIFVDDILVGNRSWVGVVGALLGGGVLVYVLSLLKHRFLERLSIRISIIGYDRSLTKLLRLPVEFFEHRLVGDLIDRVSSIDRISNNLTKEFLVLLVDMALSVILLVAMFMYSVSLTLVVVGLALIHSLLVRTLEGVKSVRSQAMRREQGMLLGIGMQMLNNAENLRMTGADDRFFARWSGQQAKELHARQQFSELSFVTGAIPDQISILRSALVLAIGGFFVIAGEMSLGSLVGFYILAEMFLKPVGRFLGFSEKRHALESDLQRLQDISNTPEDPQNSSRSDDSESISTFKGRLQLTGRIELRNVSFGYNKSRPPLIKDFSLTIEPGQRVAVVGSNGSGKSTLTRLVSGIGQPWSGEILLDGHPRSEIPHEVLRRSISIVNQEAVLFAASIRDNITLWNPAIPDDIIVSATRDACIHREILVRPDGYATEVVEGGANFSGGQRQRLEIARALVGNPSILILDEATSSLDAATEEEVDENLRRRGVTCLIVAHRLSTVRDCDEIIVLEKGEVAQRGTHEELIADEQGAYFKLVKSN